jgi:CHAD domain-containing protein
MTAQDAVEVERKFDVNESTELPSFEGLPGVESVAGPVEYELDALYFDTEDLELAASHISLRRRSGGEDEGWHLKTIIGSDARQELREPLGSDPGTVPQRLSRQVRVHVRDRPLIPAARVRTRRIVYRLLDAGGGVLAEVCDDHVRADRLVPEPKSQSWREWEIELVDGDRHLLDAADSVLTSSGVSPSVHDSKLARALGDLPKTPSCEPRPDGKGAASQVLLAHIDATARTLWTEDPRVREDEPDSVHQFRIALRRLRSVLRTFRPLIDREVADNLRGELKWMARTLGAARDLQVLHERMNAQIATEPPELIVGPVSARIDEQFSADYQAARVAGLTSLDDGRYFRLLDALDSFIASPPLRGSASKPARRIIPDLIEIEWKRLQALVRDSETAAPGTPRDLALHEVRKGAKNLRYAADAAAPVLNKAASRVAGAAEEIQTILGDHQDSVVARELLRRLADEARLRGEDGFSYGRLHALEQGDAEDSEKRFRHAWRRFPRPSGKK